jgi:maltose alpha-D-glucosyltransferase / alpha-amylase
VSGLAQSGLASRGLRPPHDPTWFKDAVFYEVSVSAFQDSDGDGIGDFAGLTQRLEYLDWLGVDCLWLLPFFASPVRDDGYDISDYRGIRPEYGTIEDFTAFLEAAHRRGIRVIADLVLNHTSDQHEWFRQARSSPDSPFRDYYVWSDTDKRYADARIIFVDTETSNWSWDPVAGAFYWHRFYSHQPDLNYDNPAVREAMLGVIEHWLDLGLDGFRCDAVPYLIEREGTTCESLPETHAVLKEVRRAVDRRYPGRILLAEANAWPADVADYFGDGDEFHMAFNFPLMPRIFMALDDRDCRPLIDMLAQLPDIPPDCQWCLFLRNHDELTLEMVGPDERDYMYYAYARDRRSRRNIGICRRLAPLLGGDRRRIELLTSLLLGLPGTPIVYYGDEIGMGDDPSLGDRDGVRTPMQWSAEPSAGFSRAAPSDLYLPLIEDDAYHHRTVNVAAERRRDDSLLAFVRWLIAVRRSRSSFGRGSLDVIEHENLKVLACLREHAGTFLLLAFNFAPTTEWVALDLARLAGGVPVELLGGTRFPIIGEARYMLVLPPFGFLWFELDAPTPEEHVAGRP